MPVIDRKVNQFIDQYLIDQNAEREKLHEPSGKLSASMLFQPVRFQVMKTLGIPRRSMEPYVLGKFKRGSDVEDWYVSMLEKMGVLVERQKPLEYRGVVGFADAVVDTSKMEFKKGIIPHEVKSVTNAKLKRIANTEVDYHYKLQGTLYALAMGVEHYAIDIVSAEDYRPNVYIFQTDELSGEVNQIISDYDRAMRDWNEQKKLPALAEPKVKWTVDNRYTMFNNEEWTDEIIIKYLSTRS